MRCPTADCRWPNFTTAAVCYQCNDVTSQLIRHDQWALSTLNGSSTYTNVSAFFLPNGAFLANLNGDILAFSDGKSTSMKYSALGQTASSMMTGFATGDPNKTVSMGGIKPLIWSLSAVQLNVTALSGAGDFNYSWPNIPVIANERALYYCGVGIASNITNGTSWETSYELDMIPSPNSYQVVDKGIFPSLPSNVSDSLEFDLATSAMKRSNLQLQGRQNASEIFFFTEDTVKSISSYFQATFQTDVNLTNRDGPDLVSITLQSPMLPKGRANIAYFTGHGLPQRGRGLWNEGQSDLSQGFARLSLSMSNAMRNAGASEVENPGDFAGQSGRHDTVYMVQWGWISLHAVLIAGGAAFYIATVVCASGAEKKLQCLAWKNSSSAVISKASELGPLFEPGDSAREPECKAADMMASFNTTEDEKLDPDGDVTPRPPG